MQARNTFRGHRSSFVILTIPQRRREKEDLKEDSAHVSAVVGPFADMVPTISYRSVSCEHSALYTDSQSIPLCELRASLSYINLTLGCPMRSCQTLSVTQEVGYPIEVLAPLPHLVPS